jgi:NADH dehydrogenase [ubiquinone] 1 alpha subcomplex assembly factor 6
MPAYMAIRAFNLELARIPDVVSNPTIGSMRMLAWRQFIDAAFDGRPPEEPVAVLLASYLHQGYKLQKSWFKRIIDARDQKLTYPGFGSMDELEQYAESTYSTLLYLTLSAIPVHSVTMDHLASHIGKATGIAAVLRGVPLLAFPGPPNHHSNNPPSLNLPSREKRGVVTLPLDAMSQAGVREENVFREGAKADGLQDAVFAIATRASDHLITARSMLKNVRQNKDPGHEYEHISEQEHQHHDSTEDGDEASDEYRRSYGVLMGPAISTQMWLDRLQKVDFDVFNESLRRAEWKLPFVGWWKSRQLRI